MIRALMLAPALAVVFLLFFGGLLFAVAQSFGLFVPVQERFTLSHYLALLSGGEFAASLWLTVRVAALSTGMSALAGLGVALAVRDFAQRSRFLPALLQIPIAVPHVAMAVAAIHMLAPSGLVSRAMYSAGLIETPSQFPPVIGDRFGLGIIAVYFAKETPFLAVLCLAVLLRIDDDYYAAARTLGASAWQRLRFVTLPLVAPVLAAGSAVVFAFIFSAFEIPYLLGRPYPAMLGVLAQRRFMDGDLAERPAAMAAAVLTAVIAVISIWGCARFQRRFAR